MRPDSSVIPAHVHCKRAANARHSTPPSDTQETDMDVDTPQQPVWLQTSPLQARTKAFGPDTSVIFTDGSVIKGKPAGAGIHAPDGSQPDASFRFSGDQTVLRAELAAIDIALARAASNPKTVVIATDSLTSLQLITKAIHAPHQIKHHRHRKLLESVKVKLVLRNTQGHLSLSFRKCALMLASTGMRRQTSSQRELRSETC